MNVTNIHNVYNTTIINNNTTTVNRVSYNGGDGGINRRPRPEEEAASRERHIPPVAVQAQHAQAARANPELRASVNHGKPPVAATPRPGAFSDRAVVPAKQTGATYNHPMNRAPVQPPATMPAKHPENNAARSDRPTPNNRPESSRPPSAQPNNRNESQRPQSPSPNERSQPPPAPLLRKRGLHRSNSNSRSPRLRSRKRRGVRTNHGNRTRSRHSNGRLQTAIQRVLPVSLHRFSPRHSICSFSIENQRSTLPCREAIAPRRGTQSFPSRSAAGAGQR